MDQWGLVHVGLAAVRETKPETWTASFQACNMDPRNQLSFADWCTKISPALMAGQKFKKETANDDPCLLLPALWHGMTRAEKRQTFDVFSRHEEVGGAGCIIETGNTCCIPTAMMQEDLWKHHEGGCDPKGPVKKEISGILHARHDADQPVAKHSKPELVDSLTKAMQDNPAGIAIVITAAESIQPAAAAAATAL